MLFYPPFHSPSFISTHISSFNFRIKSQLELLPKLTIATKVRWTFARPQLRLLPTTPRRDTSSVSSKEQFKKYQCNCDLLNDNSRQIGQRWRISIPSQGWRRNERMGQQAPSFHRRRGRERGILTCPNDACPGDERRAQETKLLHTEKEIIKNHPQINPFKLISKTKQTN